jgi:hypothetical protein
MEVVSGIHDAVRSGSRAPEEDKKALIAFLDRFWARST